MKVVKPVTEYVLEDEPCYLYAEHEFDRRGVMHRYRIITVLRDCPASCCGSKDAGLHLADLVEDMGPADQFRALPFRIPGGVKELDGQGRIKTFHIDHVVTEMREMADQMHKLGPPEIEEPTDLVQGYIDLMENRKKLRTATSTYGYGGVLVRNA